MTMRLLRDAAAVLGVLSLPPTAGALLAPPSLPSRPPTALGNMFRRYGGYDGGYGGYGDYGSPSRARSAMSGASSPNWRKNQGYNLSRPTPPELGGSFSPLRDAETNPYYDPGWAQSVRRDNPSHMRNFQSASGYNGYNDPAAPEAYGTSRSYRAPDTYPGMTTPRRTDRYYSNPTHPYTKYNPYYDPVWSQSYARREDPIREGDHTAYYAPGYDRNYYGYGGGGRMGGW